MAVGILRRWRAQRRWYARPQAHVNPAVVVMGRPIPQDLPQMPLTEWDDEVQTLPPYTAHQRFACGIGLRSTHGCSHDSTPMAATSSSSFREKMLS
jgi:hypothetical protein